jgi:hypothetical protein
MSERLERWKAAEQVRKQIGWLAIFMGIGGGFAILGGLLGLLRIGGEVHIDFPGVPESRAIAIPALILGGIAVLLCARGLWKVQPWARWTSIALCAWGLADDALAIVNERTIHLGIAFTLFAFVYLLQPSTGQLFARAQGRLPAEALFPDPPVSG